MSDPFGSQNLPGQSTRSFWGAGPWEDFEPAPGVECLLRARTLYSGGSAQFAGYLYDTIPADSESLLGLLPPAFWPATARHFVLTISGGRYNALGDLEISSSGVVVLRPRVALSDATFRVVYSLD